MINTSLAKYIIEMMRIDQELRFKAGGKKDFINFLIYTVDGLHNYRIRKIIDDYGYPTKALVGKRAMRAFWLLVQHQDYDTALQEQCLLHCDFGSKEKSLLIDRVLIRKRKRQIYGTQFHRSSRGLTPYPIQNRAHVNQRRLRVGLNKLEESIKEINALTKRQTR